MFYQGVTFQITTLQMTNLFVAQKELELLRPCLCLSSSIKTPKTPKAQNHPRAATPWPKDHINNVKLVTEVTKWVITDNLPFSMVNSKAFLSIMKQATKGKYNLFLQDHFLVL